MVGFKRENYLTTPLIPLLSYQNMHPLTLFMGNVFHDVVFPGKSISNNAISRHKLSTCEEAIQLTAQSFQILSAPP